MSIKMADKDSREEIIKAFKLFDDNCTGKITFNNLKRIAQELGENIGDEELQVNIIKTVNNKFSTISIFSSKIFKIV